MNSNERDFSMDHPADDPLELAVRALKQQAIPPGPSAETIAATLKSLNARELNSTKTFLSIPRRRLMKIAKAGSGLLLTSCVVIAIVGLRSPTSAYAQVIAQAQKAKSLSYLSTITSPALPQPAVVREFVAVDGRTRTEHMFNGQPSGMVTISDASGMIRLTLNDFDKAPPTRAGGLSNGRKVAAVYPAHEGGPRIEGGWRNSWLKSLQSLQDKPEKELGEKQLDGRTARGFKARQGKIEFEMWVDKATGRPVQIDYDTQFSQHITMTEFRFDEQLDESLFSFDPPAGYEVRNPPAPPKTAGGEESLLVALRGYTTKSEGVFPASISEWGEWAVLFSKDNKSGVPDQETTRIMGNLGAIIPFLSGMEKTDYAYRGKGRTTQDKDAVIFWYKKPDGSYRAILGDFSAKDIAAADVPRD